MAHGRSRAALVAGALLLGACGSEGAGVAPAGDGGDLGPPGGEGGGRDAGTDAPVTKPRAPVELVLGGTSMAIAAAQASYYPPSANDFSHATLVIATADPDKRIRIDLLPATTGIISLPHKSDTRGGVYSLDLLKVNAVPSHHAWGTMIIKDDGSNGTIEGEASGELKEPEGLPPPFGDGKEPGPPIPFTLRFKVPVTAP